MIDAHFGPLVVEFSGAPRELSSPLVVAEFEMQGGVKPEIVKHARGQRGIAFLQCLFPAISECSKKARKGDPDFKKNIFFLPVRNNRQTKVKRSIKIGKQSFLKRKSVNTDRAALNLFPNPR